ncbi:hypothetical protein [Vibrio coralliilyticus]|uniref:hypothetical protein n=1 Tax=Vibrio coralliilyticus TaxID=190893 RepID=UPI000BAAEE8E|nr:hypothetical protein [Vibrio coralliilyticus]NOI56405.1 hypothetical protein [Vibrio coralliilyticus]PAT67108.1 hypothetical protein CKA27_16645 [Vibrio coralliilyticus]
MMSADNWLKLSLLLALLTTLANVTLKVRDRPSFMDGESSQLYYSNSANYRPNGDVYYIEDFHTLDAQMFFRNKSYTSRMIAGEDKAIHFSYLAEFYSHNLVQFSQFSLDSELPGVQKVVDVEAHSLGRLTSETLQIIHQQGPVLCYMKLLEGSVKCVVRRK